MFYGSFNCISGFFFWGGGGGLGREFKWGYGLGWGVRDRGKKGGGVKVFSIRDGVGSSGGYIRVSIKIQL